jgi:hypothetical protein
MFDVIMLFAVSEGKTEEGSRSRKEWNVLGISRG